jgi:hypothetical protein
MYRPGRVQYLFRTRRLEYIPYGSTVQQPGTDESQEKRKMGRGIW